MYIYIIMYVLHIFECVNEYIQYMLLNNECIWSEGIYVLYVYKNYLLLLKKLTTENSIGLQLYFIFLAYFNGFLCSFRHCGPSMVVVVLTRFSPFEKQTIRKCIWASFCERNKKTPTVSISLAHQALGRGENTLERKEQQD